MANQYQELAAKYLAAAPSKEINPTEKEKLMQWVLSDYESFQQFPKGTQPVENIPLAFGVRDAAMALTGGISRYEFIKETTQLGMFMALEAKILAGYSVSRIMEQRQSEADTHRFFGVVCCQKPSYHRCFVVKPDSMIEKDKHELELRVDQYLKLKAQAQFEEYVASENIKTYVVQELERIRQEEQAKAESEALQVMQTAIEAATNPTVLAMKTMPLEVSFGDVQEQFNDVSDPAALAKLLKLAGYSKVTRTVDGSRKTVWVKEMQQ